MQGLENGFRRGWGVEARAGARAEGRGDREGLRSGPLAIPNLARLGLSHACHASTGKPLAGVARPEARAASN